MDRRVGRLLVAPGELRQRVRALGAEIAAAEPSDLLLVTLLQGGLMFLADLVRYLSPSIEVDFLRLSPYAEGEHPPGMARIVKDLDHPCVGRNVLVVEDVVDTGLSLSFLLRNLEAREPATLRVCTLLDRASKRLVDLPIAYRGFELGNEYVVGYGLDILGYHRNLPCLVEVTDLEALREDPLLLDAHLRDWGVWSEES